MKSILKFGLITGLISSIFLFGFFSLVVWLNTKFNWGLQASNIRGIAGLLSIPIQAIGIYMAVQNVKNLNGGLTYGQAVKTGLIVAITIAVIVAIFSLLYCEVINPGYREYMVQDAQKAMLGKGATQQQISLESEDVSQQFTTAVQVIMALLGQFGTGAIISLIIGIFVKTKNQAI